ncbi:MAG TPA: hypothetical protein VND90_04715 [Terracidiphilus sp.]|nr:hypothetical protein [Terracidiphilus sp.]
MRENRVIPSIRPVAPLPWAVQMRAVSAEEPERLIQTLSGAILGCGGWVLSRGSSDTGIVSLLFEFERQACLDIYSILVGVGLELSQSGHSWMTELYQCTRLSAEECGDEIVSVALEIFSLQTRSEEDLCFCAVA